MNPGTKQMHKGIDIQAKHDEILATEKFIKQEDLQNGKCNLS